MNSNLLLNTIIPIIQGRILLPNYKQENKQCKDGKVSKSAISFSNNYQFLTGFDGINQPLQMASV